jgi:hypothetical protein
MEEEPTRSFSVSGDEEVGAPAAWNSFAPHGFTGTLSVSCSGRAPLRREQWELLERSHRRKNGATRR